MATMEWVHLHDEAAGVSYYANMTTKATSWRLPPELGGSEPLFVRLAGGWLQFEDEATGRPYYYHKPTQRTVWEMPAEARPPPTEARDAAVFEAGMRAEPEGAGEEEEDDGFVDEADVIEVGDEGGGEGGEGGGEPELRSSAAAPEPLEELSAKSAAKAAKRAARRLKILEEVLNSERMYVKQLRTVNKVYIEPLRMVADMPAGKGQIFTHADLDNIFLNIDLLIKVNEGFLSELEAELNAREMDFARVEFGAIIKNAAKHMKGCYTRCAQTERAARACAHQGQPSRRCACAQCGGGPSVNRAASPGAVRHSSGRRAASLVRGAPLASTHPAPVLAARHALRRRDQLRHGRGPTAAPEQARPGEVSLPRRVQDAPGRGRARRALLPHPARAACAALPHAPRGPARAHRPRARRRGAAA
jgi:hypothetical protein